MPLERAVDGNGAVRLDYLALAPQILFGSVNPPVIRATLPTKPHDSLFGVKKTIFRLSPYQPREPELRSITPLQYLIYSKLAGVNSRFREDKFVCGAPSSAAPPWGRGCEDDEIEDV
jgi:hypothetical protein